MALPNAPSTRNLPAGAGYSWDGELGEVNVQALYAVCHALRFTGRLELRDTNHQAMVVFVGGDPVEIDGGDTQMIALWNAGQFRAIQSLPNLSGELTNETQQTGSLAVTPAKRLLSWVSEYRLSCEIAIERPGEKATLAFKNGQLEAAAVNETPELAALARVTAWTDGFYRVSLRPLFSGEVVALKPPPIVEDSFGRREFDVSRSIPLDLKLKAKLDSGEKLRVGDLDTSLSAEREALRRKQPEFQPPTTDLLPPLPPRVESSRRWPIVIAGLLVASAAALGGLFALHLPPFSPPPRPIVEAPVVVEKPVEAPKVEEPKVEAPKPVVEAPVEAPKTPPKKIDEATLAPPAQPEGLPAEQSADERLVEKGRFLLIDGHPHSAVSLFRAAAKANPKNTLAPKLEQEALGKLGHADVELVGKGKVMIDGKRFDAPKKLKVFAGPHSIDTGEGPSELVLKKNEHKKLHVRS